MAKKVVKKTVSKVSKKYKQSECHGPWTCPICGRQVPVIMMKCNHCKKIRI